MSSVATNPLYHGLKTQAKGLLGSVSINCGDYPASAEGSRS
jgi:hypothetical protein